MVDANIYKKSQADDQYYKSWWQY